MPTSLTWNLTIEDSSPTIVYQPYVDGVASSTWATYDSVSGFQVGETRLGNSSHVTWSNRSSVYLRFFGSAIYVYGEANCTYDITIDDVKQPSSSPNGLLLASFPELTQGEHIMLLKPNPGGSPDTGFAFEKALVTVRSLSGEADKDVYDSRNSSLVYSGVWSEINNQSIPSTSAPAPYYQTQGRTSLVSLEFYGDTVVVEGPLGWKVSQYSVTLDGRPYNYNASSEVVVGNTVMFYTTGLDTNKRHSITLGSRQTLETSTFGLNSITVFGSQGRKTDKSLKEVPVVPILASVLVVVVFLHLLGGGIYLRRQRQKQRREAAELAPESTRCEQGFELATLDTVTESAPETEGKTMGEPNRR